MIFMLKSVTIFVIFSGLTLVAGCPEKWQKIDGNPAKCVRYFHSSVNFTEAQYICHVIYDGDLLVINSLSEQKQIIQYLHDQLGFDTQPVTWLGGTLTPPNEVQWIDGSPAHYTNFAQTLNSMRVDVRKCLKIFSLFARGASGAAGQWSADLCTTRDSGYVCQKPYDGNDNRAHEKMVAKFGEQLKIIKELCESQIKLIETLASNFFEQYEPSTTSTKKIHAVKIQGT
ncbi:C-type lectin mannose-binding isoform-like protein [Leptotrombidium deliense]|uniref:C-type lectin mannose-binding isoform-like protein n=1 Tax=Leptotrombidium deliense TaxID=299467 RepID=A0A443SHW2_9ACAR|nr:C-type lectin mannose-binding isoform-like protein [Leptotrombidium deliense]